MFPQNIIVSGKQILLILESIKSKLDQLPDSCLETLASDLQTINSRVDLMVDGSRDCKQDSVAGKELLVNKAMALSNIALRKSQELFRVALANAPVAVFQTDLELRYTWFYSPYMGQIAEEAAGQAG